MYRQDRQKIRSASLWITVESETATREHPLHAGKIDVFREWNGIFFAGRETRYVRYDKGRFRSVRLPIFTSMHYSWGSYVTRS